MAFQVKKEFHCMEMRTAVGLDVDTGLDHNEIYPENGNFVQETRMQFMCEFFSTCEQHMFHVYNNLTIT